MDEHTTQPEDCPTPEYHKTHHYCPSCSYSSNQSTQDVPPMQNGIDMKSMYAGVYMAYRAIEDNYEGSMEAYKSSGSPKHMAKYIGGKKDSLNAADSEKRAVGRHLNDTDREEVERKVESLISFRRLHSESRGMPAGR